jgi:hypothetical protein
MKRLYPKPKEGDLFGRCRIVRCLGSGHAGRSDLRYEIECIGCGRRGECFEFALHVGKHLCAGRGHRACPYPDYVGKRTIPHIDDKRS